MNSKSIRRACVPLLLAVVVIALTGAIKIAHRVWQPNAWTQLAQVPRGEAETKSEPDQSTPDNRIPDEDPSPR